MNEQNENEDDIVIEIPDDVQLHLVHVYLPYSHQRIKQILRDYFNCRLERYWQGYKANRRPGYCEIYAIVNNSTNEIIFKKVTLEQLRYVLAEKFDFPLHEPPQRNPNADLFLKMVKELTHKQKK